MTVKSTPVNDWLRAHGHKADGRGVCEKCWRTAASMYAMGQGPYNSHSEAYHAAMQQAEEEAMRAVQNEQHAGGAA